VKICDGPMFHLGTTGNDDDDDDDDDDEAQSEMKFNRYEDYK
jgi:hypothetical protein